MMSGEEDNPWAAFEPLLAVIGQPDTGEDMQRLVEEFSMVREATRIKEIYWEAVDAGISLRVNGGHVHTIFLHAEGKDDFREFVGPLPPWFAFTLSKDAVRAHAGEPSSSKGRSQMPGVSHGGLDRFTVPSGVVHLTYWETGGVSLVALFH